MGELFDKFLYEILHHYYDGTLYEYGQTIDKYFSQEELRVITRKVFQYRITGLEVVDHKIIGPIHPEQVEVIYHLIKTGIEPIVRDYYDYLLKTIIDYELKEKTIVKDTITGKILEKLEIGSKQGDKYVLEKPEHLLFLLKSLRPVNFFEVRSSNLKPEYEDKYLITSHYALSRITRGLEYTVMRRQYYCYKDYPKNIMKIDQVTSYHTVVCYKHFRTTKHLKEPPLTLIYIDSVDFLTSDYDAETRLLPILQKTGLFEFQKLKNKSKKS